MQLKTVKIDKPDDTNFILGQTHFIKSVEDIHEALVAAVPGITLGPQPRRPEPEPRRPEPEPFRPEPEPFRPEPEPFRPAPEPLGGQQANRRIMTFPYRSFQKTPGMAMAGYHPRTYGR
jgi:hypothetical protein